ncbi:MAG: hypothetical protein M3Y32_12930 [Pseudomonadota bacterium]|nr:hypothetical protein [Pseudomonadota bacterium]
MDFAQLGMAPARQGFEGDEATGLQFEERLVRDRDSAVGHGAAQVAFESQALRNLDVQRAVEQREARLACGLRFVHGSVGVARHVAGARVAGCAESNTDAHAAGDVDVGNRKRQAQRLQQALGQPHGITFAVQVLGQDRELITAEPCDHIARAQLLLNALAHCHQEFVAGCMPQAVVDKLEPVEVQKHQTERPARAGASRGPGPGQRFAQNILKVMAVGQPRQAVAVGHALQPGFGLQAGGDVLQLQDRARGVGLPFGEVAAIDGRPQFAAIALHPSHLRRERLRSAVLQAADLWLQPSRVARVDAAGQRATDEPPLVDQTQQPAQRGVGLQHLRIEVHQGHADRCR